MTNSDFLSLADCKLKYIPDKDVWEIWVTYEQLGVRPEWDVNISITITNSETGISRDFLVSPKNRSLYNIGLKEIDNYYDRTSYKCNGFDKAFNREIINWCIMVESP